MLKGVKELLRSHGKPPREVYFDSENSGWVPPEVVEAMLPYFNKIGYGHPSITNKPGWEAYEALFEASSYIARTINADSPTRLTFTHSGTEANNLAVMGAALARGRGRIVVSAVEHLSVMFPAEHLARNGFKLVKIPVDGEGFIDLDKLSDLVTKDTVLVSIMSVNHEIGTVEPVREAVEIVRDKAPDVLVHTDAADAYGRIPLDVKRLDVDLLTISSHKIHGPRGVGVLYIKEGVKLEKILFGQLSTQELWPGVENVPLIMGFKRAAELAFKEFEENVAKMRRLRDMLIDGVLEKVQHTLLNGPRGDRRSPDNVNISFLYCEGEAITVELSLRGIYVSSGSACTSRILEPSHVLLAIGRQYEEAHGSILFKITRYHTEDDIKYTLDNLPKAIERLRSISPIKPGSDG